MPSSVIRAFRYHPEDGSLHIVFVSGRRYAYQGVPPEIAEAMATAFSKGQYFNSHIRDRYRYVELGPRHGARNDRL